MPTLLTIEEAKTVFAGRNPEMYNFLDAYYLNTDWNTFASEYEGLETDLDNGNKYGIVPAPVRPFPPSRP